jgi:hypothetical protein
MGPHVLASWLYPYPIGLSASNTPQRALINSTIMVACGVKLERVMSSESLLRTTGQTKEYFLKGKYVLVYKLVHSNCLMLGCLRDYD